MPGPTRVGGGSSAAALEAQRQAEAARRAAEAARKAAEAAAKAAAEAQAKAARERAQSDQLVDRMDTAPGGSRAALAKKLTQESGEAAKAEKEAKALTDTAAKAEQKALDTANAAINKSHDANAQARLAGKQTPYGGLDSIHDAVDATRLSKPDQQKLLGFTSVADPKQAVARDLQSLQRETDRGGREGAAELRRLMETNQDPGYRRLLAQSAAPQVERISEAVNRDDDRMDSGDLQGTLRDLSRATVLGGPGPDGGAAIARAFSHKMQDDHLDLDDGDQFAGAARAVIEEGETPEAAQANALFFGVLSNELKAQDRNPEAQQEINKAINEGLNGRPGFIEQVANKANPVADALGGALNFAGDRLDDVNSVLPDLPGTGDIANAIIPGKDLPIPNFKPIPDPSDALGLASGLLHGTGDTVANAPEMAKAVATAVEYRSAIDKLGPNDKFTLGAGAKGAFAFGELGAKGKVEVTRERDWVPLAQNKGPDGKPFPPDMVREGPNGTLELKNKKPYVIAVDGEISAGVMGQLGAKGGADANGESAGAGGGLSGRAGLSAGGKVELRFESAAEAKRAMDIIGASAVSGALSANIATGGPATAALAQPIIDKVFGASAKDLPSLGKDVSAVEVRLGAYGELSGSLKGALDGVSASAKADLKGTVRVEMSDGKPTWLATRIDAGGEVGASGSLGKKPPKNAETGKAEDGTSVTTPFGGKTRFEGSLEFRRSLADGFNWKDLAGVTAAGSLITEDTRAKLTLANETEGSAAGNAGGVRSELELHGEPNTVLTSGALGKAFEGDLDGAMDSIERVQKDAGILVTGRVLPYSTVGVKGGIEAKGGGVGLGLDFEAGRRDYREPLASYAGNASALREDLGRLKNQLLRGIAPTGNPIELGFPMYMRG
ncbi:hypothetical protein [Pyxidicoccus caerfyrddinensis]|uniref:hypothetical protein n=1 Tax=Pyxidicoccus caerfyrddinensis TaxID=2709663 RepID=UPI0013DB843E|nr:hypothetical protein [Pyxidicoccus caerfyrddinensis]